MDDWLKNVFYGVMIVIVIMIIVIGCDWLWWLWCIVVIRWLWWDVWWGLVMNVLLVWWFMIRDCDSWLWLWMPLMIILNANLKTRMRDFWDMGNYLVFVRISRGLEGPCPTYDPLRFSISWYCWKALVVYMLNMKNFTYLDLSVQKLQCFVDSSVKRLKCLEIMKFCQVVSQPILVSRYWKLNIPVFSVIASNSAESKRNHVFEIWTHLRRNIPSIPDYSGFLYCSQKRLILTVLIHRIRIWLLFCSILKLFINNVAFMCVLFWLLG